MISSIIFNNKRYTVYEFDGIEKMNEGYTFDICIISDHHIQCIDQSISLSYLERKWVGIITQQAFLGSHLKTEYHYKLTMKCTFLYQSQCKSYAIYYQKNIAAILEHILDKIPYIYKCIDHKTIYWMRYKESVQEFINRIVFHYNIIYFCESDNDRIVLIDNISKLENSEDLYVVNSTNYLDDKNLTTWHIIESTISKSKIYGCNDQYIIQMEDHNDNMMHNQIKLPKDNHNCDVICDSGITTSAEANNISKSHHNQQNYVKYVAQSMNYRLAIGKQYKIILNQEQFVTDNNQSNTFYTIEIHHKYKDNTYSNICTFLNTKHFYCNAPTMNYATFEIATVIGDSNKYIDTKNGLVKVNFDWECDDAISSNKNTQYNKAYIPNMNAYAGNQYGHVFTPRIGNRVIIGFISGNPNKPFIAGSLYQINNAPAYSDDYEKSYIRTKSLDNAQDKYNEIVFCDTPHQEHITQESCGDINIKAENNITNKTNNGNLNCDIQNGHLNINLTSHPSKEHTKGNINITTTDGGMYLNINDAMKSSINQNCHIHINNDGYKCEIIHGTMHITVPELIINASTTHIMSNDMQLQASNNIAINGTNISISGTGIVINGGIVEVQT